MRGSSAVIFHRNLSLAVRSQAAQLTAFSDLCESARHFMRQRYRKRHKLGRIVAGVAEHHTLVPCAVKVVGIVFSPLIFKRAVNPQRDVGRLLVYRGNDRAGAAVKA